MCYSFFPSAFTVCDTAEFCSLPQAQTRRRTQEPYDRPLQILLPPSLARALEHDVRNLAHAPVELAHHASAVRWELHEPRHHRGKHEQDPLQRRKHAMAKGIKHRRDGRRLAPQRAEVVRKAGEADAVEPTRIQSSHREEKYQQRRLRDVVHPVA